MSGKVQTVLGVVEPSDLGRTLTHEHISINFKKFQCAPPKHLEKYLQGNITLDNVGFVQRYPYANPHNMVFDDEETKEAVIEDLRVFKQLGGGAIVENSNHGLCRRADVMYDVSQETSVHIIAGTGFYIANLQPEEDLKKSVEEIHGIIYSELTQGAQEFPKVKCGFIGEVGSDYPLKVFEENNIKATAMVQSELKCPVSFHPGRDKRAPFEIMRKFTEAGGNPKKTIMSHLDRTLLKEDILEFASEFGCYTQFDLFGTEVLVYQLCPTFQMPSDSDRAELVCALVQEGRTNQVLLSHDIHTKHRLLKYGGHGYTHIFTNVIPKLQLLGVSDEAINQITEHNPQSWLTWNPV